MASKNILPHLLQKTFEFRCVPEWKPNQCDNVNVILEPVTSLKSEMAIAQNIDISLVSKTIRGPQYIYILT